MNEAYINKWIAMIALRILMLTLQPIVDEWLFNIVLVIFQLNFDIPYII